MKVLELSRILAGPWACQILADLGADVIKVEQPGKGDETRLWGPPFIGADAAYFHSANRGKRSIALDLATPRGQLVARALAARSDVLMENFRAGVLKKFGLDHESLKAAAPRLVYCSITGFGQDGPYAHRPGFVQHHEPPFVQLRFCQQQTLQRHRLESFLAEHIRRRCRRRAKQRFDFHLGAGGDQLV